MARYPLPLQLQPRDRQVLACLYRHGFLLRDHLHTLCFPNCALRRVTRRLQKLAEAELIVGEPLPLGAFPLGIGSLAAHQSQFAYRLSKQGANVVSQAIEVDAALVRRRTQAAPSYVGHAVAVASIATAFQNHAQRQNYQLGAFLCASEAKYAFHFKRNDSPHYQDVELLPDGLVSLVKGASYPIHIEADMATQGRQALESKLEAYFWYAHTGALNLRLTCPTLYLALVTTSPERVAVLLKILGEMQHPELAHVRVTTFSELTQEGPFGLIWRSSTSPDLSELLQV
jgi:hypothetical protein